MTNAQFRKAVLDVPKPMTKTTPVKLYCLRGAYRSELVPARSSQLHEYLRSKYDRNYCRDHKHLWLFGDRSNYLQHHPLLAIQPTPAASDTYEAWFDLLIEKPPRPLKGRNHERLDFKYGHDHYVQSGRYAGYESLDLILRVLKSFGHADFSDPDPTRCIQYGVSIGLSPIGFSMLRLFPNELEAFARLTS